MLLFFSETADGLPSVAGGTKFAVRTALPQLRVLYVTVTIPPVTWPQTALGALVCRFVRSSKPPLFAASKTLRDSGQSRQHGLVCAERRGLTLFEM